MRKSGEQKPRPYSLLLLIYFLLSPVPASAQSAGQVVAQEGTAEVLRGGTSNWIPIVVQGEVFLHDELRTQAHSRLQVRFQDESVLTLAENTHLTVDEQIVQPAASLTSVFSLLVGKVRVFVTDRYKAPGSKFEVHTPTVVAGVRGTEFIITYPWVPDTTRVIGVEDRTQADSRAVPSQPVFLDPQLFTDCSSSQACTPPQLLPPHLLEKCLKATMIKRALHGSPAAGIAANAGMAVGGAGIIGLGVGLGLELDGDSSKSSPGPAVMSGTQ